MKCPVYSFESQSKKYLMSFYKARVKWMANVFSLKHNENSQDLFIKNIYCMYNE